MSDSNNDLIVKFVSGVITIFFISFLLNFFGFISLDKFWFWKNSEKNAASEISFILKTPVEKINQSDLFLALNPSQKSPKAIDARTKFKNLF